VEDALRTASLPALPQNGLLLIRRLNLGKLTANPASITVARRIASRLLALNVSVVRQHTAEQPRSEVVWFADDVEPYAILAELLVRNIQPQSWYWPRAVRGWSARMTPQQGLRHVLYEVSRTPAGITAASRVVEQVISAAGAGMLGRTLQPDDGHRLLALGGIQSPEGVTAKEAGRYRPYQIRHLDRSWRQALGRLAPQWGQHDNRTIWLAHAAAWAHSGMPGTYAASGLLHDLRQGRPAGLAVERQHPPPVSPLNPDTDGAEVLNFVSPDDGEDEPSPVRREGLDSDGKVGPAGPGEKNYRPVSKTTDDAEATDTASAGDAGQPHRAKHFDRSDTSRRKIAIPVQRDSQAAPDPSKNRWHAADAENGANRPSAARSAVQADADQPQAHPDPANEAGESELVGAESKHAGLVFVLQALAWLGIREALSAHPALEVYQLPARILWHCADQLGISRHDPICQFMPPLEPAPAGVSFNFVAPAAWHNICWTPASHKKILAIRRVRNTPGKRVLDCNSGSLTIALWQDQFPAAARSWVQGCVLRRQAAAPPVNDLELIIGAWVAAMGHFLHKYAQTNLGRMVTRPGDVATTRTHLDVTFDPAQLDIGIRRAGLDIDPGWVPWLGRVVYIHYQSREEILDG
jgi:hypothetical protein